MVEEFGVDISAAKAALGWGPAESIDDTVRQIVRQN
jgi:nucleoside-diphosphate-sugar epimerase